MKWFIYVLLILLSVLVIYNITLVNFSDPFGEDSIVALITVLAGCCGVLILAILLTSRKIAHTLKNK